MDTTISVSDDGKIAAVAAAGEIDLATHAALESAIATAAATPGVGTVVVDLAGVDFLDSSGIAGLIRGRRIADAAGIGYRIAGAAGITRQVLEMSGVWAYLSGHEESGSGHDASDA